MIGYYIASYLVLSVVLAMYVYNDTLNDYKFRARAKQFALATFAIWPALLIVFGYVVIYVRIREWNKK